MSQTRTAPQPGRPARLLFVHAHPDDETLATGVALATYALAGHDVHVLTATLGDEGEVIPDDLAHLEAAAQARAGVPADRLGLDLAAHRRRELAAATAALGVTGHLLGDLGDPASSDATTATTAPADAATTDDAARPTVAYRDSGMAGTPSAAHPRALTGASLAQVADAVRAVVERLDPDVVVTYDAAGGYGHPDHIRVHEATCRAVADLAAASRPRLFAAYVPLDRARADRARVAARIAALPPQAPERRLTVPGDADPWPPSVVDPAVVTHEVVGPPEALARRDAALRAHRTQVTLFEGDVYALSNDVAAPAPDREGYGLLDPETGRPLPPEPGRPGRGGLLDEPPGTGVARVTDKTPETPDTLLAQPAPDRKADR